MPPPLPNWSTKPVDLKPKMRCPLVQVQSVTYTWACPYRSSERTARPEQARIARERSYKKAHFDEEEEGESGNEYSVASRPFSPAGLVPSSVQDEPGYTYPLYIPLRRGNDNLGHLDWLRRGWNIALAAISHVAFYAWSAVEVTEILKELAASCPNLESVTIGYTTKHVQSAKVLQDILWCGVDYPANERKPKRVTPDLGFFAEIVRYGQASMDRHLLDPRVIPGYDMIMNPCACSGGAGTSSSSTSRNSSSGCYLHPMEQHFAGRGNCPVIQVVEVPLMWASSLPKDVGDKLRFLSPTDAWVEECPFAERKKTEKQKAAFDHYHHPGPLKELNQNTLNQLASSKSGERCESMAAERRVTKGGEDIFTKYRDQMFGYRTFY